MNNQKLTIGQSNRMYHHNKGTKKIQHYIHKEEKALELQHCKIVATKEMLKQP